MPEPPYGGYLPRSPRLYYARSHRPRPRSPSSSAPRRQSACTTAPSTRQRAGTHSTIRTAASPMRRGRPHRRRRQGRAHGTSSMCSATTACTTTTARTLAAVGPHRRTHRARARGRCERRRASGCSRRLTPASSRWRGSTPRPGAAPQRKVRTLHGMCHGLVRGGFIAPEAVVGWWIEVVFLHLLLSVSRPGGPAPTSEDAA